MGQAKSLSERETRLVLATIAQGRHAPRNRAMFLLSLWGGMRVGEIAALRIGDVANVNGEVKSEIRLSPAQTKGNRSRVVIVGDKLQKELQVYLRTLVDVHPKLTHFMQ
jgi:integrase/recombinase XerD